jgi:hypothetical protein
MVGGEGGMGGGPNRVGTVLPSLNAPSKISEEEIIPLFDPSGLKGQKPHHVRRIQKRNPSKTGRWTWKWIF